jgi:hypothetical protein
MICNKCNKDLNVEDFPFRNKSKNIRNKRCKYCQRESTKAHYANNKSDYLKRAKKKNKEIDKEVQFFIAELKNVPCADCNKTYHHCAMDFDHVRGNKVASVSSLKRFHSFAKIKKEIAKCEVVCAVCHRIRTFNRLQEKRNVVSN